MSFPLLDLERLYGRQAIISLDAKELESPSVKKMIYDGESLRLVVQHRIVQCVLPLCAKATY